MLWRRERKEDGGRKEAQGRLWVHSFVYCNLIQVSWSLQIHFQDWLLENSMRKVRFGNSGLENKWFVKKKKNTEMHKINFTPKFMYFLWLFFLYFLKESSSLSVVLQWHKTCSFWFCHTLFEGEQEVPLYSILNM